MTRAESEGVQEQYVYFPGCLETQGEADASGKGIVVFERVPVVKDDRPKAFREKAKDDFTGWTVWASSIVAARWAASRSAEFSGRDVLELGSGCGLAGLVVAQVCNPSSVCLTDYNAGTVGNLRANVAANCEAGGAGGSGGNCFTSRRGAPVSVDQMDWDEPETWPAGAEVRSGRSTFSPCSLPALQTPFSRQGCLVIIVPQGHRTFDVVIGADLLYRRSYARKLAVVLDDVLRPGGTFLCATPAQREGLPLLLRLLEERGYTVEEKEVGPEWRGNPLAAGSLTVAAGGQLGAANGAGASRREGRAAAEQSSGGGAAAGALPSSAPAAAPTDGLFPELYMRAYPLLVLKFMRAAVVAAPVAAATTAEGGGAGLLAAGGDSPS